MALTLELHQKQALSQRMIQSVNILQMTAQELTAYVDEIALENPAMDIQEKSKESIEDHQWQNSYREEYSYYHQRQNHDDDYDPKDSWNFQTDQSETLYDYLRSQLITEPFSKGDSIILDYLLENLDERGYLLETTEHMASLFHESPEHIEHLIHIVQSLEPSGICARNLPECLEIQLKSRGLFTPVLGALIHTQLELLGKNKFAAISKNLCLSMEDTQKACQLIRSLNPKPGSAFYDHEDMKYIIPDVVVVKFDTHFQILLNDATYPDISINSYYQDMYQQTADEEVKGYLRQKIQQAEWVKQCIAQRSQTLMTISREIFKHQEDFFLYGPEHLHPLKMSTIAEIAGVHESTVSRAVDKKYLQCTWGVYPLGFFFQRSVSTRKQSFQSSPSEKTEYTSSDIKKALQALVAEENKKKPYSDRILSELLTEKGMSISRRTVAKYREEEGIPDASGRKGL